MRQRQLIEKAIGPAPWFWETFPEISGASGRKYIWKFHGEGGPIGQLVTLTPRAEPGSTVLALNTHARAFAIPESLLGLWCPEPPAARGEPPYLRVMAFDPDALQTFALDDIAGWFKQSNDRVYSATAPVAEFELPSNLPAGTSRLEAPREFAGIEELLLVDSHYVSDEGRQRATAIYQVHPRAGTVDVLPQRWFDQLFKDGMEWIARVTRDPVSQRLIGDGPRIRPFELAEDGMNVARWIE